ncbi:MAG: TetR/AcrR family transcriptional regulator [Deltaproteobacteria bacterium]|nr:TetR/AcrR family transcriptional regulator [Deltaproteobacteria bacterium]
MTYREFTRRVRPTHQDLYAEILAEHRDSIKAKKEATAVKNLELIFEATLQVANQKGFQAMTMRDLCHASGLSMGALYDYFSSKEELLEMVQRTGRSVSRRLLREGFEGVTDPVGRLAAAIRTHVFLSEAMQPWFFFSYMEARHLGEREKNLAKDSELRVEAMFAEILAQGQAAGAFGEFDPGLAAAVIKAMMQDWYLKRWKYAKRGVGVDRYAELVVAMVLAFCRAGGEGPAPGRERQDHEC